MGRKKAYNEEEVLEKAMYCFWNNGYLNTSIRQLEQQMGINQFSIYSSFGSKDNLYLQVLNNYVEHLKKNYLQRLMKDDADINDIEVFLIDFGTAMAEKRIPASCLMIRSMISYEIFSKEIQNTIDNFTRFMEKLFRKALIYSKQRGLVSNDISVDLEAQYLSGITQSLSLINKHSTSSELKNYIESSMLKLK